MPDQTGGHPYVFVSYASVDRDRVLPIIDRLEAAGVKTWIDRDGIHGGANYAKVIAEAIEHASAMLLMCSAASLRLPQRQARTGARLALREAVSAAALGDRSRSPKMSPTGWKARSGSRCSTIPPRRGLPM